MKKLLKWFSMLSCLLLFLCSYTPINPVSKKDATQSKKMKVVVTTNIIYDATLAIGKDKVDVEGLMGAGVDPHLYQPTSKDTKSLSDADLVLYSGLHLEGKMGDMLKKLNEQGKTTVAVAEAIPKDKLLKWDEEGEGEYDPHVWWSPDVWKSAVMKTRDSLIEKDPSNKDFYTKNADAYLKEIAQLVDYSKKRVNEIPKEQRILITAHDAFQYFSREFGFEVKAVQGISTDSEASAGDIDELAKFIADHKIKAIFVESSVPKKTIESLQEAVKSKGFEVKVGGELYSDALGEDHSYVNGVKHNIDTIVDALK